ncbi:MAG: SDR family oxidoreductase [Gammaproteobacteria bacterium]|nr:SDR family oxidoreductase [Gammaproteobacteria bacterium]
MQIDLSSKHALVTGAASGIGARIAELYAECGAHVAVHARTRAKAESTVEAIKATGGKAFSVEADLMDSEAIEEMCQAAISGLGGIDIVMNNAGTYTPQAVVESDAELWRKTMAINLEAPRLITQITTNAMIEQGTGGRQLYTSSVSAIMAEVNGSAYCASKAGLNSLARCLAVEVGKHGITVNTINPGWVDTPMARKAFEDMLEEGMSLDQLIEESMSANTLGLVIKPKDIAAMAAFLASDYGRCITGQDINVCAGISLLSFGDE